MDGKTSIGWKKFYFNPPVIGSGLDRSSCGGKVSALRNLAARASEAASTSCKATNLLQSLKLVAQNQQALVFVGDSVTRQSVQGFLAETLSSSTGILNIQFTNLGYFIRPDLHAFQVVFTSSGNSSFGDAAAKTTSWVLDIYYLCMPVVDFRHRLFSSSAPRSNNGHLFLSNLGGADFRQLRERHWTWFFVKQTLQWIVRNKKYPRGIVLIVNVGIWYNREADMREDLVPFLQLLNKLANIPYLENKIYWRETSAQHFEHSPLGYYPGKNLSQYLNKCVAHHAPIKTTKSPADIIHLHSSSSSTTTTSNSLLEEKTSDWRNDVVKNIIFAYNLTSIQILPFFADTQYLHNFHTTIPVGKAADCTHFCYHPCVFGPFYQRFADALIINTNNNKPPRGAGTFGNKIVVGVDEEAHLDAGNPVQEIYNFKHIISPAKLKEYIVREKPIAMFWYLLEKSL